MNVGLLIMSLVTKKSRLVFVLMCLAFFTRPLAAPAQSQPPAAKPAEPTADQGAKSYSGMYTFLKEGEFVQITVEDDSSVSGFISRYGEGESDKGLFLDQFFKTGKLAGAKLTFKTQQVHGVDFDFNGTVERGEGKNPGDDAYFVLKGTLTENTTDANKKVTSRSQEVVFKMFPQDAAPPR
ncbi:MAG TPA: hypothetical protein VHW45_02600 [Candidatus Sulfotelmatobacter sp.]|nr:hypothetical protein [Candidatus Sulfotelmatobacter sp.]